MNVDVAMELIEVVRTLILLGDTTSAVTVLVEAKGVDLFDMSRVWKLLDKDMNERGTLWGLQGDDEDQTLWRAFSYAICTRVETRWKQDFPTLRKLLSHIVGMEPPDDCYSKFNYALYKAWEVGAARIPGVVFTRHAWILDQGGRAVRIFRTGWKGEPTVIYVVSEGDTVMHCSRDFFRSRTNARYHAEEDCAPMYIYRYTVPEPLARALGTMGTHYQDFDDGYDAMRELAAGRYRSRVEARFLPGGEER